MRAAATSSKRAQFAGVLMLGMATLAWADKVQEASADFLEYLGSLEDEDDNWTDFTAEALAARQAHAASSSVSNSSSSASSVRTAAASSKSSSSEMSRAGK